MATPLRQKRVADRIQAELADLLLTSLKDPRLHLITVTRVVVDRELEYANIFVASFDGDLRHDEALAGLHSAQGFIRRELARRVQLRKAPMLRFHWDAGPDQVEHMAQLMDKLNAENPPANTP